MKDCPPRRQAQPGETTRSDQRQAGRHLVPVPRADVEVVPQRPTSCYRRWAEGLVEAMAWKQAMGSGMAELLPVSAYVASLTQDEHVGRHPWYNGSTTWAARAGNGARLNA